MINNFNGNNNAMINNFNGNNNAMINNFRVSSVTCQMQIKYKYIAN